MISTVTTSTVSTVTTAAIAGSVILVGVFLFFAFLLQKEVALTAKSSRMKMLGQILNIGLVPLSIAFVVLVITTVINIFQ